MNGGNIKPQNFRVINMIDYCEKCGYLSNCKYQENGICKKEDDEYFDEFEDEYQEYLENGE